MFLGPLVEYLLGSEQPLYGIERTRSVSTGFSALIVLGIAMMTVVMGACSIPSDMRSVSSSAEKSEYFNRHCSSVSSSLQASWDLAIAEAKAAYREHAASIQNSSRVAVINYVTPNDSHDRLRLYDPTNGWALVSSHWVSHAFKSDVAYEEDAEELLTNGCATHFSNVPGSNLSSKGAMVTVASTAPSEWGRQKLQVKGLDPALNGNVYERFIVFHQALAKDGTAVTFSLGCFMLRPNDLTPVLDQIVGGALVYAHHR